MSHLKITLRKTPSSCNADARLAYFFEHKKLIDAVSILADFDGFTHANATLIQHHVDRSHFFQPSKFHDQRNRVTIHPDFDPMIITSTVTPRWEDFPNAAIEIFNSADCEGANTLCISQFGWLPHSFPLASFMQFVSHLEMPPKYDYLNYVVIEIDEKFFDLAHQILVKSRVYYCSPLMSGAL
jgi:hypothetical protein